MQTEIVEGWAKAADRFGWIAATLMAVLGFGGLLIWRWFLPLLTRLIDGRSQDLKEMLAALAEQRAGRSADLKEMLTAHSVERAEQAAERSGDLKEMLGALGEVRGVLQGLVSEVKALAKTVEDERRRSGA